MRTIEIDDETYQRLFRYSAGFDDTPSAAIERLMDRVQARSGIGEFDATIGDTARSRENAVRRGERTAQSEFHLPILRALQSLGGSGSPQHVVDQVGRELSDRLTDVDHQVVSRGEPRWRNTARWARKEMVELGLLERSPHGTWTISDAGRRRLVA